MSTGNVFLIAVAAIHNPFQVDDNDVVNMIKLKTEEGWEEDVSGMPIMTSAHKKTLERFREPLFQMNCEEALRTRLNELIWNAINCTKTKIGVYCEIALEGLVDHENMKKAHGRVDYVFGDHVDGEHYVPRVKTGVLEAKHFGEVGKHYNQFLCEMLALWRRARDCGVKCVYGVISDTRVYRFGKCDGDTVHVTRDLYPEKDGDKPFQWLCYVMKEMGEQLCDATKGKLS